MVLADQTAAVLHLRQLYGLGVAVNPTIRHLPPLACVMQRRHPQHPGGRTVERFHLLQHLCRVRGVDAFNEETSGCCSG